MLLSIDRIVKRFGAVTVLGGVSLVAAPAAVTGLIGPNGSGKTTLFDVITGFVAKDAGRVLLDGVPLDGARPHELAHRGLIRTFQVPRVARRMTLLENLMVAPARGEGESILRLFSPFHAQRIRQDEHDRLERAWRLLAALGLERHANDLAEVLSGGEMKLLSIGIALMTDPNTLLLDEPTAGVNPVLIERILKVLAAGRDEGRTTLIIEHNIAVISEICDTVYVLDVGEIIASGSPSEVRRDERVIAAYLGRRHRERKLV
ncbi:MAG TPA: ABC transporter ATP-binding protein [bacterium]|nr:ABC transporter ATP-binding protein [bacterium]